MKKMVFVPLSDEMLYERPELITGPIGVFKPPATRLNGLTESTGTDRRSVNHVGQGGRARQTGTPRSSISSNSGAD
jgi:hypothetical protein